ncbi:hypothetical protein L204_101720 [Cryptococcus depauperatus]|nr:hypothetical protein L204_04317 [Cryptococcus depauperatus CBS 7855]
MSQLTFTVFGGGGQIAKLFTRLAVQAGHAVNSVIKDDGHQQELQAIGAKTHILSLADASVSDLASLLETTCPDVVLFSAGAGGKPPGPNIVDYQGAVKVFDALEQSPVQRLIYVGAVDVRSRDKPFPDWYDEEDKLNSGKYWEAIGSYMQAKLDAELDLHTRTSIDYTVLRPGMLTPEPAAGVNLGKLHIGKTSRELIAKVALAVATTPGTKGLTIDVMDGEGTVNGELEKVVSHKIDAWTG